MQGIRLSHGVIFVTDGLFTVRLLASGKCGPSPIGYHVLERDMQYESPDKWDYVSESELRDLPDGGYDKIAAEFERIHKILRM